MKVVYIHHAAGVSGAMRSLAFLISRINLKKIEPVLYCTYEGSAFDYFKSEGIIVKKTKRATTFHGSTISKNTLLLFINRLLHLPITAIEAFVLVRRENPDVLHLNSTCLFPFAIGSKLARRRTKVVTHVREPIVEGVYGWPLRYFTNLCSDYIIAICNNDMRSLHSRNSKKKSVIYNFVDFNVYNDNVKGTLREELKIDDDKFVCLFLARFDEANGFFELVGWAKKISKLYPHIHFVFAGGDYHTNETFPNIDFVGFRNDVPNIIASCDINIVPFIQPHFARSVIECSAMGKPSVGNKIGGVDELIVENETGFLYDNSFESLLSKIVEIQNKDIYTLFSHNCISFAQKNFDIDVNASKTFDAYNLT